jgi:hypothetical protein
MGGQLGIGMNPSFPLQAKASAGSSYLAAHDASNEVGAGLWCLGSATTKNWLVSSNVLSGGNFEIIQSTANGGSTAASTATLIIDSVGKTTINAATNNVMNLKSLSGAGAEQSIQFINAPASGSKNFLIGHTHALTNAFEITPSTANDGTTFSTPLFVVHGTGVVGVGTGTAVPVQALSVVNNIEVGVTVGASGNSLIIGSLASSVPSNDLHGYLLWNPATVFGGDNGDMLYIPRTSTGSPGAHRFYTGDTTPIERVKIDAAGSFLVGTGTAPSGGHTFYTNTISAGFSVIEAHNRSTNASSEVLPVLRLVKGTTTNTSAQHFVDFHVNLGVTGSGYIGANGANTAAFFTSSDARIKKDIAPLSGALDIITALNPVTFKWKADDSEAVGFIAQELAEVLPKQVHSTDDGEGDELPEGIDAWSMTDSGMIPYLVKAIQELKADNDAMKVLLHDAGVEGF